MLKSRQYAKPTHYQFSNLAKLVMCYQSPHKDTVECRLLTIFLFPCRSIQGEKFSFLIIKCSFFFFFCPYLTQIQHKQTRNIHIQSWVQQECKTKRLTSNSISIDRTKESNKSKLSVPFFEGRTKLQELNNEN